MKNFDHGWLTDSISIRPLIRFAPILVMGKKQTPQFGDKHSLLLLKRFTPRRVSFIRAYTGWKFSSSNEEKELGAGRAFLRWLVHHDLSIEWKQSDFFIHHYFTHRDAPCHDPSDEMARDLSFCIKPVVVAGRRVKLYVQDEDMLSLISLPYGNEEDFLELVEKYIEQRFEWAKWKAPSPSFLNWMMARGSRPLFRQGQLGFRIVPQMPLQGAA